MAQKPLGKSHQKGIPLLELTRMFSDEEAARQWFEGIAWLNDRSPVGKTAVAGPKDRPLNQVAAPMVRSIDTVTLQDFVTEHTAEDAPIYSDEPGRCIRSPPGSQFSKPCIVEYVRVEAHPNSVETCISTLKRAHKGTLHKISPTHLQRCADEFAGRHNVREDDTISHMASVTRCLRGKHFRYATFD